MSRRASWHETVLPSLRRARSGGRRARHAGADKSTLIRSVAEELLRRDVATAHHSVEGWAYDAYGKVLTRRRRLTGSLVAAMRQPRLAAWCVLNLLPGDQRFSLVRMAWLCRSARNMRRLRREPGVRLIDEGPMKVITPMIDRGVRRPDLVLRLIPAAALYVAVTVDADTSVARMNLRGNRHVPDCEIRAWHLHHQNDAETAAVVGPVVLVTTVAQAPTGAVVDCILELRSAQAGRSETPAPG